MFESPRMKRSLLLLSLLALAGGCRGPKGSPGGTVKSFYSCIVAEDWDTMIEILSKDSMAKLGSVSKAQATFARDFSGWHKADISIEEELIDADGKHATVKFECVSTQMVNYKATQFDCSDTYSLVLQDDGNWHLHLPTGKRLRAM